MIYYQFEISLDPFEPWAEILTAYLGEIDFEGFYEKKNILHAFVSKAKYSKAKFEDVLEIIKSETTIDFVFKELPHQNWNALWESNFEPVFIENKLAIVAPFHTLERKFEKTILIEPKMSFGTGHHQTTYMMCATILNTSLENRTVLDMGSGTGVLAILCEMNGAKKVLAVDIEPWSVENCSKNTMVNNCSRIQSVLGDIDAVKDQRFDAIFANINKNILLNHMPNYAESLNPNGFLYLSGFFSSDAQEIKEVAEGLGLIFSSEKELEGWCMLVLKK
jgi:ribosomal protein L11 methyltransferase